MRSKYFFFLLLLKKMNWNCCLLWIYFELYWSWYSVDLNSLEQKFVCVELSSLSRTTYHFIDKYNCKGEYVVHRVYICLNKSSFVVQQYDQLEGYDSYNHIMSSFSSFVSRKPTKFSRRGALATVVDMFRNKYQIKDSLLSKKRSMMRTCNLRILTMKVKNKVLHNDISMNLMLPNFVSFEAAFPELNIDSCIYFWGHLYI
jgi:hypothetical protein